MLSATSWGFSPYYTITVNYSPIIPQKGKEKKEHRALYAISEVEEEEEASSNDMTHYSIIIIEFLRYNIIKSSLALYCTIQ